jgi:DNA polymerase III subunit epsilon
MLDTLFDQFDSIVFVDTETSGLNPRTDEIIELGILRVVRSNELLDIDRETGMLIRLSPGRKLSYNITQITGITQLMLDSGGAEKAAACQALAEVLGHGSPLVVAYNAHFDLSFLYHFLLGFGMENVLSNVKMLDALTVFRDRREYPHKLDNAVAAYTLAAKNTHRAIDDARTTYELLCAMDAEEADLDRYINLFGYNPKYGITGSRITSVRYLPQLYKREKKLYE